MTLTAALAALAAVLAIAYACHWSAGCYRRNRAELHDHLQALSEFHTSGDGA